jgi:hypothetical protein
VVYPGGERYKLASDIDATPLHALAGELLGEQ